MTSIKRKLADWAERLIDARIVRPGSVGSILETDCLSRFFTDFRVDCVFDVGANDGQYADRLRRIVGFTGPIISFEPIPELAQRLRKRAVANEPQWFIEQVALDRTAGEATFNVMAFNEFSSMLEPDDRETGLFKEMNRVARRVRVKTSTLKDEFSKFQRRLAFERPFLKMDTQGNDVAVADGAGELISRFVGIQAELSIKRIYENSPSLTEALAFFISKGFELTALVPNNQGHFPYLVEIDAIMFNPALAS